MARIDVRAPVLRWAIKRSGVPRTDLRHKFPKIDEWEAGEVQPTLHQLEAFARATSTPFGYLFLHDPPQEQLSIPHFRTVDDHHAAQPSPDLLETVQQMERRQGWMREALLDQGQEPLAFVHSADLANSPRVIAAHIRTALGLQDSWAHRHGNWSDALRDLRVKMEESGILVVVNGIVGNNTHRPLSIGEFRGFVLVDKYAPLVFINGADGKAAQMFTLAHELAHIWFGVSAAFDLRRLMPSTDQSERACNSVAAEFLVPEVELRSAWPSLRQQREPFQAAARRFKVSTIVAARRAFDVGLISRDQFFEFYDTYEADERRVSAEVESGGDFYASQNLRISKRFGDAVIRAVKEGRLLYQEAYRLTGISGKTFDRYATLLGLGDRRAQ
jgi:Zn-dependent peptidase ImmA (M78 family)